MSKGRRFILLLFPVRDGRVAPNARAHWFELKSDGWRSLCGRHWIPIPDMTSHAFPPAFGPSETDKRCRRCIGVRG